MTAQWVRDIDSLYNFVGYVVLCAPDRFPKEDYLRDEEQMTLERAFSELRRGAKLAAQGSPNANSESELSAILTEALELYRLGREREAAHRVQDFQDRIFKE